MNTFQKCKMLSIASLNPLRQTNQTRHFPLTGRQRQSHLSPASHLPHHDTIQTNINVARNRPCIPSPTPNITPSNPLRETRPLHPAIPPPLLVPQPHVCLQLKRDITNAGVPRQCCKIQRARGQGCEKLTLRLGL